MANFLLAVEQSLGDKVVQGLIVTVTGVVLVFLILAFLILVCILLKHFNTIMNRWDSYMGRVRLRRGEVKKLKTKNKEELTSAIQALGDMPKETADIKIAELKAEYKKSFDKAKAVIDDNFAKVSAIEKEMRAEIKSVKAEYKTKLKDEVAKAKSAGSDVKATKLLITNERNVTIKNVADNYKARIAALSDDGIDDETIAVITAVITAMTASDAKSRNVRYTIKSIKKI